MGVTNMAASAQRKALASGHAHALSPAGWQACTEASIWPRYARSSQSQELFNPLSWDIKGPVASVSHAVVWMPCFCEKGPWLDQRLPRRQAPAHPPYPSIPPAQDTQPQVQFPHLPNTEEEEAPTSCDCDRVYQVLLQTCQDHRSSKYILNT